MESIYDKAHEKSIGHRHEIEASSLCGCFHCMKIYKPSAIEEWIYENENGVGDTAICPRCGIDSVLGDASGFELAPDFLKCMNKIWF